MEHLINTLSSPCPSPAQAGISFSRWEAEDLQFKFTQPVSGRAEIQLKSDSRKPVLDTGQSRHPLFREWVQKKKKKKEACEATPEGTSCFLNRTCTVLLSERVSGKLWVPGSKELLLRTKGASWPPSSRESTGDMDSMPSLGRSHIKLYQDN